ncbi:MAG: hypothetical protein JNK49_09350 [Planctomycetes bacterium]|nr:hypothetical protein [Planctomycetota bacterium]
MGVVACASLPVMAQGPVPTTDVQVVYSTHDKSPAPTTTGNTNLVLPEVWADVKTPGNGFTYSVGTIEVNSTQDQGGQPPQFSGADVGRPLLPVPFHLGFTVTPGGKRQIVLLQCAGPGQQIVWQRYFYGSSSNNVQVPWARRATNARGVSVWPAATPEDTRVAICGETYDMMLSQNQYQDGSPNQVLDGWWRIEAQTGNNSDNSQFGLPNGYVAVYNGNGLLLWSYQFFFHDYDGHCAITDLSVRVETVEGQERDVVTYCGISTFGVPTTNTLNPLAPRNWFLAPVTNVTGYFPGHGAQDNNDRSLANYYQWDGIVGRLRNAHSNPVPSATDHACHAVVGGREQDGLWGMAELDEQTFVVGGGTAKVPTTSAGAPNVTYPLTQPAPMNPPPSFNLNNPTSNYCIGTVSVFVINAATDVLSLVNSSRVGEPGTGEAYHATHVRDIAVQRSASTFSQRDRIIAVGATREPNLHGTFTFAYGGAVWSVPHAGPVDGFVAVAVDLASPDLFFTGGTYLGSPGNWCGVAGYPEFRDHVAVLGQTGGDLTAACLFFDTPSGGENVRRNRLDSIPSSGIETPAAMGARHAARPSGNYRSFEYQEFTLGPPSGGGAAMDGRARVSIVGSTNSSNYPFFPPLSSRNYDRDTEAVRTVMDMLPNAPGGVCRTDGTGIDATGLPVVIQSGADGGTSPACMRLPWVTPNGDVPADRLPRMWIDYEGPAPGPGQIAAITVDRSPPAASVVGSFLCYGLPANPMVLYPNPLPMHDVELWIDPFQWSLTTQLYFPAGVDQSWRFPLAPMPPVLGARFTVQVVAMLATSLLPSPQCPSTMPPIDFAASPALVFYY